MLVDAQRGREWLAMTPSRYGNPGVAGNRLFRIMKNDAQRMPMATTQAADPVPQVHAIHSPSTLYRSMVNREYHCVALAEGYYFRARLHSGSLFRNDELASGEVLVRARE